MQFAALFTVGFIPFLAVLSIALDRDETRSIVIWSGLRGRAAHDVTILFTHGQAGLASLSILSLILAVIGGDAIARVIQSWYARIFGAHVRGWKGMTSRAEWLAGVLGYITLQVVIDRTIQPLAWHIPAASAQFAVALVFWWWSLHCLLSAQISWRRLFPAGLATAICYTGLGLYLTYAGSVSIVSNESRYGPIGTVITLTAMEIGLGVVLQLGAVIGATVGHTRPRLLAAVSGPGERIRGV